MDVTFEIANVVSRRLPSFPNERRMPRPDIGDRIPAAHSQSFYVHLKANLSFNPVQEKIGGAAQNVFFFDATFFFTALLAWHTLLWVMLFSSFEPQRCKSTGDLTFISVPLGIIGLSSAL